MAQAEPTRLLIAAMGGEGGGVLAGWITEAAMADGLWVQRTSVPGVAQRTGATTYYLEFLAREGDRRPVMALNPAPGRVDVLVATELLEAVRMVEAGFVTPERTYLLASTHRVFTVDEKSAMADGRLDPDALELLCRRFARDALMGDLGRVAAANGCHLNAVLLGVLAGSGRLPIGAEACRAAVAGGGRAVDSNLRGFDAGLELGRMGALPEPADVAAPETGTSAQTDFLPGEAARLAAEGVLRLTDFQDARYAGAYLDHLRRIGAHPAANEAVLADVARHLAIRMSYEDTFRVAQIKLRDSRLAKVRAEAKARPGDIVDVIEYMKPGPEEIFGMFPAGPGARLTALAERRGWDRLSFPMKVRTTRFSGFIRLRALAALRRWRPRTLRHAQEMAWVEGWLGLIARALDQDAQVAVEIAQSAKMVRGYGATYKRGLRNWNRIVSDILEPGLAGVYPPELFADAVLQARLAALSDPEGSALDRMIAAFQARVGAGAPRQAAS